MGLAHDRVLAVAKGICRRLSGRLIESACQVVLKIPESDRVMAARLESDSMAELDMATSE
jgi:hypothetical protein